MELLDELDIRSKKCCCFREKDRNPTNESLLLRRDEMDMHFFSKVLQLSYSDKTVADSYFLYQKQQQGIKEIGKPLEGGKNARQGLATLLKLIL